MARSDLSAMSDASDASDMSDIPALEADEAAQAWLGHKMTLSGAGLKRAQRVHAWVLFTVPLLGVVAALGLAMRQGVSALDLGLFGAMYLLTFCGITVGFHRLLAHRSFQTGPAVRGLLTVLGAMAAQGPPIYWVSNHRRHHRFSDQPGDPHSPHHDGNKILGALTGLWHAQVAWTYRHEVTNALVFSRDFLRDPLIGRINRSYHAWVVLGLLVPALVGGLAAGTAMGALSGFLWGGLVRMFLSYHAANSINSITHLFGARPFETREHSRNNAWIALPTCGEAWHNNHHAFPGSAIFGLQWWQVDIGGIVIRLLEGCGLAWDVKTPSKESIASKRLPPQDRDGKAGVRPGFD